MVGMIGKITCDSVAWLEPHGGPDVPGVLLFKNEICLIIQCNTGFSNEESLILCRGQIFWIMYDVVSPI